MKVSERVAELEAAVAAEHEAAVAAVEVVLTIANRLGMSDSTPDISRRVIAGVERLVMAGMALDEAYGRPLGERRPPIGEPVQIIINARRGPLDDRWIIDEPYPSLIADDRVIGWRPMRAADWQGFLDTVTDRA